MSVSFEQAKFYADFADRKWQTFDDARKMRATRTATVEEAEKRFRLFNAQDKHAATLDEQVTG